ncbi:MULTISPECIES: RICIN domain-containing protein [unclassified Crossiella]|uniref:RICIN domain-containing protein n=1 Tax=unclassified Crossiella TaxID=2620835 RepID=UPI002000427E|nr:MULTISPECIES: RICIN domain-containing protein [unclassified Crossiella]MCK2244487.1 RICIN domain-containing protein [Crossiella sp. S99.2]MCK2258118.1 RICIN domain-containing protein [Crossiella sp. S99.1]
MGQRMRTLVLAAAGLLASAGLSPASAAAAPAEDLRVITSSFEGGQGCLAPLWGSTEPGAYISFERCDKSRAQAWHLLPRDGVWGGFRSATSGLCLTVLNSGTGQGEDIVQQPCAGAPNQRWRSVSRDPFAKFLEEHAQHSDKCLSAGYTHHTTPAEVVQLDCLNVSWQKFAVDTWSPAT